MGVLESKRAVAGGCLQAVALLPLLKYITVDDLLGKRESIAFYTVVNAVLMVGGKFMVLMNTGFITTET